MGPAVGGRIAQHALHAVGALIALPALRLSGIYLALGTAAFATILDRWIFTLPRFSVFGWFDGEREARSAADSLASEGLWARAATTLTRAECLRIDGEA